MHLSAARSLRFPLFFLIPLLVGCTRVGGGEGLLCTSNSDCASGEVCSHGVCTFSGGSAGGSGAAGGTGAAGGSGGGTGSCAAIVNGDFESGLSGWTATGTTSSSAVAQSGNSAAQVGSQTVAGASAISQTFTVPAGATGLSFWYQGVCNDTVQYSYATATLLDNTSGATTTLLPKTCAKTGQWVQVTSGALAAGDSVTLTLANQGEVYQSDYGYTLYDNVQLTGCGGSAGGSGGGSAAAAQAAPAAAARAAPAAAAGRLRRRQRGRLWRRQRRRVGDKRERRAHRRNRRPPLLRGDSATRGLTTSTTRPTIQRRSSTTSTRRLRRSRPSRSSWWPPATICMPTSAPAPRSRR